MTAERRPRPSYEELEQMLYQSEQKRAEEHEQFKKALQWFQYERKWTFLMYRNPSLSPAQKIVAAILRDEERVRQNSQRDDGLTPIYMPVIAEKSGMSDDTAGKTLKKLSEAGIITRKVEASKENGVFSKRVYIATTDDLNKNPGKLELIAPRNHGGKRVPICGTCGSKNITIRTSEICRDCGCTHIVSEQIHSEDDELEVPEEMDVEMVVEEIPIEEPEEEISCEPDESFQPEPDSQVINLVDYRQTPPNFRKYTDW